MKAMVEMQTRHGPLTVIKSLVEGAVVMIGFGIAVLLVGLPIALLYHAISWVVGRLF
jgi:hypothetical protein